MLTKTCPPKSSLWPKSMTDVVVYNSVWTFWDFGLFTISPRVK